MAQGVLCAAMLVAPAAASAASGTAMDARIGAPMTAPPLSVAPIETLTRRAPPAPKAGPLRPAEPVRLERAAPGSPQLPPAEPITPARELAQLRRAAEPRSGFGSTRAAADAAWTLGLLHLHGGWVEPSPALALTWFQRATLRGRQPLADAGVAWCLIDGCQGPPDPAGARRAIERLRARHPARSTYLEWVLNTRLRPGAADSDAATHAGAALPMAPLLRRAAAGGDSQARVELGIDAVRRGDLRTARQYFQGAASRSPAAAANLRWVTQHSTWPGPARDDSEVGQILARAQQFHRGAGVPANYAEAMRLYRLAAARGNGEAQRMVALIASRPGLAGSVDIGWMAQLAQLDTRTSLPQLDTRQAGALLQRDATPLYDLVPPQWQRRMRAARPA